mmetsp:Transcript_123047/g.344423  ORF Transcript_123047/g.344423 Transcript_123047/m.344423 type:complete len:314 (+) Transcript_123047:70-1011(+)
MVRLAATAMASLAWGACAVSSASSAVERGAQNPIRKVVTMLQSMQKKVELEGEKEKELYDKFLCHCKTGGGDLQASIAAAEAKGPEVGSSIEAAEGKLAQLKKDVKEHQADRTSAKNAMAEATAIREKEHSENTQAIADAAAGVEAVKSALVVLKEFYASQAGEGSFLQRRRQMPEMAAYKGMQNAKGGVIGMLEVIESDFARLKAETETAETQAASEYDKFMAESTASKKAKHEEEFKLKLDKDQAEFEREQTQKDLRAVEEELAKANEYFETLKPACLQVHVNWEERVAKRQEEIEALKQAWEILDRKSKE